MQRSSSHRRRGSQQIPSGPVGGTKITREYAALVARDAFFWAWPMVNGLLGATVAGMSVSFSKTPARRRITEWCNRCSTICSEFDADAQEKV
jgi:hypothetical protein